MRITILATILLLALSFGPVAAPAAATTCVEDLPCPPPAWHPKQVIQHVSDTVRCLILAQPPTGCV